jgi:imidazolonepropionase-like amidohydrolase
LANPKTTTMRILLAALLAMLSGLGVYGQILSEDGMAQHPVKAIKAGRLIDPASGTVLENVVILVDHDSVKAIGKDVTVPDSAQMIDLSAYTVLPGLIDCHTHLTSEPSGDYYADIFRRTPVDDAITSPKRALKTLLAGFTTCRDVGSRGLVDVALRNAINRGDIPGPRL